MPTWFVTGGNGFIGRAFLRRLAAESPPPTLRVLTRDAAGLAAAVPPPSGWTYLPGDLRNPASYGPHLSGADTVFHLAAVTGHAPPAEYRTVNVQGTERLLAAAQAHDVRRFVFVSSVAAGYPDIRYYPYAASKLAAEELVRASGIEHLILRPTIVLGPGSPAFLGLTRLACGVLLLVPGSGRVPVQPIAVADVATALVEAGRQPATGTITLGGPDLMSMLELLRTIRRHAGKPAGPILHLPLGLMRHGLAAAERLLGPRLPLGAGQLAVFANASDVPPPGQDASLPAPTIGIAEMLHAA